MKTRFYHRLVSGVAAGTAAAMLMACAMALAYLTIGLPALRPVRLAGASLLGEAALLPSAAVSGVVFGMLTLLFNGACFGALFALFTRSHSYRRLALVGAAFGLCLWAFMQLVFLPWTNINLALQLRLPYWIFALGHLAYGAGLSSLVFFERKFAKRELSEVLEHPMLVPITHLPGPGKHAA